MIIDPSTLLHQDAYKLLTGSVLPRPIAFVSTCSADGCDNLAPFSFFMAVCASPLTIAFAPMRRPDGSKKDTLLNIEETGEFVVHVVDEGYVEQMNHTAANFAPDVSELHAAGFTALPSEVVKPLRIAEAPVALECRLAHKYEAGEGPGGGTILVGTVLRVHVRDALYENGKIVTERWRPLGRLAGPDYVRLTDTFVLERPVLP